jgi:hypothetical protein
VGTVVEVSGFADATAAIVASRVDMKSSTANLEIKGMVEGLDTATQAFQINGFTIDYSTATTTGTLASGSTVEVQGTSLTSAGALLATSIEVLPGIGAVANSTADIEGIITTFTSNADFVVQGQHVATDANTQFISHGVTLAANVEVDVQGQFNASGTLQAQKVEAKAQSGSLVRGLVDSVTASSNTLSILGVSITVSASTELQDTSSQHVRQFRLTDVQVGDYVEADGAEGPPGTLSASVLERESSNGNKLSYLQGVALNVAQPNFTILGVTVATTAQTHFAGPGGSASGATTFFGQAANRVVKVSGTFSNGVLTADHVQIEQ